MENMNNKKILSYLQYDVCIQEVFEKPDPTPVPVLHSGSTDVKAMIKGWCKQILKNEMKTSNRTYKIVEVRQSVNGNLKDEKSWTHIPVNEECGIGIAPFDGDETNIQSSNLREAPVYRFVGENFINYNVEIQIVAGHHKKVNPTDLVALLLDRTVGFHNTDHLGTIPNKSFSWIEQNEKKSPFSYKITKCEESGRIEKVMDYEDEVNLQDEPEPSQELLRELFDYRDGYLIPKKVLIDNKTIN